jgi:aminoglycoside phosphotransferase (APT) family kinase protein
VNGVSTETAGIDSDVLSGWIRAHLGHWFGPARAVAITGGQSNLTYRVDDASGRSCVVRRPPLGERLATAHDVGREYRVLAALRDTEVPVPRVVGFCDNNDILGAPFYVMHYIEGLVLRTEYEFRAALIEPSRSHAGEQLVDTLVALHAVEPAEVGLHSLGAPTGYVQRQLSRWQRQWDKSRITPIPAIDDVARRLADRIPTEAPHRILHGDYRLDNVILDPATGAIRAVLDWELCTLGDPLADLGLLAVYSPDRHHDNPLADMGVASLAAGFPTRDELLERYARRSGRDITNIDHFIALGYWKLAIIVQGVYARTLAARGDTPDPTDLLAQIVQALARAADGACRRNS